MSALKILLPKDIPLTKLKFFKKSFSLDEKPPSGPISIVFIFFFNVKKLLKVFFFSVSSQKIIWSFLFHIVNKFFKFLISNILGTLSLPDCWAAATAQLFAFLKLNFLITDLSVIIG